MKQIISKMPFFNLPALIIAIAIILGCLVVQKIYFTILLNKKLTPQVIEEIFEKNFKKAIQFDNSSLTLWGNVILKNVKIAPTTDFNDNYNLVSCKSATIDLNYLKAITGTIEIRGIAFSDASMTIVKNYGKSYSDTFKSIFLGIANNEKTDVLDSFYIKADGRLQYNESLSSDKLIINIQDISLIIKIKNKQLLYGIKGVVKPLDNNLDSGKFNISGIVNYTDTMKYTSSHHNIYIKKLDLRIANYFLKEYSDFPVTVRGYFYSDCRIVHDAKYAFNGTIEFDNCTIENIKNTPYYEIVSKDNISINAQMEFNEDLTDINVSSFSFKDKELSINVKGSYVKDKLLRFNFSTNKIDLEDCDYIQLLPGMRYDGSLVLKTECDFDIANGTMKLFKILCDAYDVSVNRKIGKNSISYLQDARLKVDGDIKTILLDFSSKHEKSDISLQSKINIDKWAPFTSTTEISFISKKLYTDLLVDIIATGISLIYASAIEDMGFGYNEIFFRDKPLGKYLTNNIIKLKINIARLIFNKNAQLKNISIDILSNKGNVATPSFTCEGYSGIYSFNVNAFCNCDYPSLNFSAGVSNFDYGRFLQDGGQKNATGIMNASLNYSVSGYRLSHLLKNGNGFLQVTVANTLFDKTLINKKIGEIAANCNISFPNSIWRCNRLDVTVNHVADRWILQNMFIDTDMMQLRGYGSYTIDKGLSLPCYATLFIKEGPVIRESQRVNFVITGSLDNPVIVTGAPCDKKEISVFDVN